MRKTKLFLVGGLLLGYFLVQSSLATVVVTFDSTITAPTTVQYFWEGQDSSPTQTGGDIGAATSSLSLTSHPAKRLFTDVTNRYAFFSADGDVNSQTLYVRLRSGDFYTPLQKYDNPPQALVFKGFNSGYVYRYAAAAKGVIGGYKETVVGGSLNKVEFVSAQLATTSAPGGSLAAVEVRNSRWSLTPSGGGAAIERTVTSGPVLTLEAAALSPGVTYQVRVQHQGYTGGYGDASDPISYRIGGGTTTGGGTPPGSTYSITFNLVHPTGSLGINPIAAQFTSLPSGNQVKNLVDAINTALGTANRLAAIGWWDTANQRPAGYLLTYSGSTVNYLPVGGAAASGNQLLSDVSNGIYQISLERETTGTGVAVTLTGTR